MATRSQKRVPKAVKKTAAQKPSPKKSSPKKPAAKKAGPKKTKAGQKKKTVGPRVFRVDLSAFPSESVISSERSLCVACVWQIFTRAMKLAPKTALAEMKRYTPSFEELTSAETVRPFFTAHENQPCPYCVSPA